MLFIDTLHVYEQLQQELALHADKVRHFLVLHDTTTFAEYGEPLPGFPFGTKRGIWPAIEEFLFESPKWTLASRVHVNNGLTILVRRNEPSEE